MSETYKKIDDEHVEVTSTNVEKNILEKSKLLETKQHEKDGIVQGQARLDKINSLLSQFE